MNLFLLFYNIFVVPLLWCTFRLGGLFNKKIRRGIIGRKHLFSELEEGVKNLSGKKRIWFHASSLGEFEQAKPIIAAIKLHYPYVDIIATFFSPSGFDNSKNYKSANIISYIPFDSHGAVRRFIAMIKPDAAVMVRYDIWPNMIFALHENNIPTMIANATMREHSPRTFPFFLQFHRALYNNFSHILTVSKNDLLAFLRFDAVKPTMEAIGDTRFDQVMMRSIDAKKKYLLSHSITDNKNIFIVGQSWSEDDDVIIPVLLKLQKHIPSLLTIIVPHEPTVEHLEELESKLSGAVSFIRFSELNNYADQNIILIDSIGILVALYKYADVVYIGGSFKQGIHNVLEPAVFGKPVIYGPKYTNSQEAEVLAERGGGFVVTNEKSLYKTLRSLMENADLRNRSGAVSESFVKENCGATERFLQYLEPFLK